MSLTGRNPTIRLSIIRSQIDKQQQIIALLENRLQESILGGTDVGDIFADQDLDGILGQVAQTYGDDGTIDSKFGYVLDASGNPTSGVHQFNATTGQVQSVNSDPNLAGDYEFFNTNGELDTQEYARYKADYKAQYGELAFRANAAELLPTYTGLTGAMHKGVLDFQQVDENDNPLPLEQDGIRQLLYQARALMGELRVEEQHWNAEVNEEKSRRKELIDFTKG